MGPYRTNIAQNNTRLAICKHGRLHHIDGLGQVHARQQFAPVQLKIWITIIFILTVVVAGGLVFIEPNSPWRKIAASLKTIPSNK